MQITVFSSLIEAKQHLVLPEVSPLAMGVNRRVRLILNRRGSCLLTV
jgi:elongation factor P--beta-lysine ligase